MADLGLSSKRFQENNGLDPKAYRDEQTGALDRTMAQALHRSPDAVGKAMPIARQTGVSIEVAERRGEELRTRALVAGFNSKAFREQAPGTAQSFLQNPQLAAIAWDDLDTLHAMEQSQVNLMPMPQRWIKSLADSTRRGFEGARLNALDFQEMMYGLSDAERAEQGRLAEGLSRRLDFGLPSEGVLGFVSEIPNVALESTLPSIVQSTKGNVLGSLFGGAVGFVTGGATGRRGGKGSALTAARAGAKVGARIGGETGSYLAVSAPMAGSLWRELGEVADLEDGQRRALALAGGAISGAFEKGGVDAIVKNGLKRAVGDGRFRAALSNLGAAAVVEGGTEAAQSLVESATLLVGLGIFDAEALLHGDGINEKALEAFEHTTPDGETFTGVEAVVLRMLESAKMGVQGGVGAAGGISAARVAGDAVRARTAKALQPTIDSVANLLGQSKVLERDPASLRQIVQAQVDAGKAPPSVFIDGEKVREYFQNEEFDEEESYNRSPGFRQKLELASRTGADLEVPYAEWVAYVAPTAFGKATLADIRVDPTEMTANEAEAWEKENFGGLRGIRDMAAASRSKSQIEELIRQELRMQFAKAGGSQESIERTVDVFVARAMARAERSGRSLKSMLNEEGLFRVEVEGKPFDLGPSISQKIRRLETLAAVKDVRENRAPDEGMSQRPILDALTALGGVDPTGDLAVTLRELGVKPRGKGVPRDLFRPNGIRSADQIVAEETPLFLTAGLTDENGLNVDPVKLEDALTREMGGRRLRTPEEQEAIGERMQARAATRAALEAAGVDLAKATDEEAVNAVLAASPAVVSDATAAEEDPFAGDPLANELFSMGKKGPRGSIRGIDGDLTDVVIRLFNARDGSTMLHEGGHLWLAQLRKDAARKGAPAQLVKDWQTIASWLRVKPDQPFTDAQQERFAKAVELYFMEGRAPSLELEGPFRVFSLWLTKLYKSFRNKYFKDVKLTDPVRQVLDRMLATDRQIQRAAQERGLHQTVLSREDGLSQAEVNALTKAVEEGRRESEMAAVRMAEVRQRARHAKRWKENLKRVRAEVEAAVDQRPEILADQWLRRQGEARKGQEFPPAALALPHAKFDRDRLVRLMGSEAVLKALPPGAYGFWQKENGHDPDIVAEVFGFPDGASLVSALSDLQSAGGRSALVDRLTEETMKKRFGAYETEEQTTQGVLEAVTNEKAQRALYAEDRALAKVTGKKNLTAAVAERIAKRIVKQLTVRDLMGGRGRFSAAARFKAAAEVESRRAIKAHADGNLVAMQLAKQRQMVNLAVEREARKIEGKVAFRRSKIEKMRGPTAQQILGRAGDGTAEFQDQMAVLLGRFGFGPMPTKQSIRKLGDFAAFWSKKTGQSFPIPAAILNDGYMAPWDQLTVDGFNDVADGIAAVYGAAKSIVADIDGSAAKLFETNKKALQQELEALPKADLRVAVTKSDEARKLKSGLFAALKQMEFVIGRIGPRAREMFWQPLAVAESREADLTEQVLGPIAEAWQKLTKGKPEFRKKAAYPLLKHEDFNPTGEWTLNDITSMAFNLMNESNATKAAKGYGWTEQQMFAAIDAALDDEHWDFIELAVEKLQTLWPLATALEIKLTGVAPKEIEARSFTTKTGRTIKGGYFPVVFDLNAAMAVNGQIAGSMRGDDRLFNSIAGLQRAVTGHTHMLERDELANAPIKFSMEVLPSHIKSVIHDLTHREALLNVWKLVKDKDVVEAMTRRLGANDANLFPSWVQDIAQSQQYDSLPMGEWLKMARRLRARVIALTLAFRPTTLALQPFGNFNAFAIGLREIGPNWRRYHAEALHEALRPGNVGKAYERVAKLSPNVMKHRLGNHDRDMHDTVQDAFGADTAAAKASLWGMTLIGRVQLVTVDVPVWLAAYRAGQYEKGMTEAQAIDYADSVVTRSQGSGSVKNRSAFLRSHGLFSQLTAFFTYFNTVWNGLEDVRRLGLSPAQAATQYALMVMVPAYASFMLRQTIQEVEAAAFGIDDPDDDESVALRLAFAPVMEYLNLWPLVRETASIVPEVFGVGRAFAPTTPVGRAAGIATSAAAGAVAIPFNTVTGDPPSAKKVIDWAADVTRLGALWVGGFPGDWSITTAEKVLKEASE